MDDEFEGRPELIEQGRRAERMRRIALSAVALYCMLTLTLVTYGSVIGTMDRNLIIDCTTPGGDCYQQSQGRTGEAVSGINLYTKAVVIIAAACADRPGVNTERQIEKCVNEKLEELE